MTLSQTRLDNFHIVFQVSQARKSQKQVTLRRAAIVRLEGEGLVLPSHPQIMFITSSAVSYIPTIL